MSSTSKTETALITGGCSGIGYAIACELAGRGFRLVLVSNQEERLKEAAGEIRSTFNTEVYTLFLDLARHTAATDLYNWCHENNYIIDVLVNNAGMFFFGEVTETPINKARDMMSLHVSTPAQLCLLFSKDMKQRRQGNIIIISSLASYMPYPGIAFYAATKRFLKSFSRSLRTEMLDYNVNVTCVCPGAVYTNLYNLSDSGISAALKTGIMMRPEKLAKQIVRAMLRKKSLIFPGMINKIALPFLYIIPHGIIVLVRRYSRLLPPDKNNY